jgi:hypothetical protein
MEVGWTHDDKAWQVLVNCRPKVVYAPEPAASTACVETPKCHVNRAGSCCSNTGYSPQTHHVHDRRDRKCAVAERVKCHCRRVRTAVICRPLIQKRKWAPDDRHGFVCPIKQSRMIHGPATGLMFDWSSNAEEERITCLASAISL